MIGESDCGAIGGMKIGRGNRSTWRKPAPEPEYMRRQVKGKTVPVLNLLYTTT
jgi:ribosomal protein L32E